MRIILFTGKGGVGKTTTAAASAVQAARAGIRTLVMSTDAAHSLGDTLDRDLDGPGPVQVEPHLHALQVSSTRTVDASWRTVQDYLLAVLGNVGVDPVVAEELTSLPGAEEIAALLEVRTQVESGLALPEALAWHLERLLPGQRALLRTFRPAAAAATGMPLPGPVVLETVRRWSARMRDVQELLTSEWASVRLVLTPERVVIAESRRTWTSLSLYGFVVDQVVVNRIFPDAAADARGKARADPWRSAWNTAQREGLVEVADSFAGIPIVTSPYLTREPVGPDALGELARARGADDLATLLDPVRTPGLTVRRAGEEYVLTLPLPLVGAAELDLKRRGADLLVVVGEHRRVLTLPAVLRRCVVRSAAVRAGTLKVRFVPDEAAWPTNGPLRREATA